MISHQYILTPCYCRTRSYLSSHTAYEHLQHLPERGRRITNICQDVLLISAATTCGEEVKHFSTCSADISHYHLGERETRYLSRRSAVISYHHLGGSKPAVVKMFCCNQVLYMSGNDAIRHLAGTNWHRCQYRTVESTGTASTVAGQNLH